MRCFQIEKDKVLIIDGNKVYEDTLSNFKVDSGLLDLPFRVWYNDSNDNVIVQKSEKSEEQWLTYPLSTYDSYIDNIDSYIEAKNKRNPTEETTISDEEKLIIQSDQIKSDLKGIAINAMMAQLAGSDLSSFKESYQTTLLSIDDTVAMNIPDVFPVWSGDSVSYTKDERVTYDGVLYRVLQNHTSQAGWTPTAAPSLFAKVLTSTDGTPQEWEQPDSTNPYMKGDKVVYNSEVYESLIDNNVWSPDAYPQGWKLVDEGEE